MSAPFHLHDTNNTKSLQSMSHYSNSSTHLQPIMWPQLERVVIGVSLFVRCWHGESAFSIMLQHITSSSVTKQVAQKPCSHPVPFAWTQIRIGVKPPVILSGDFRDTRCIWFAFNPSTFRGRLRAVDALAPSYLGVVGRLLNNFGSHPERRPHKRLPLDLRVRQLTSHAEVSQLHLTVLRQQHVGRWGQ